MSETTFHKNKEARSEKLYQEMNGRIRPYRFYVS